MIIVTLLRLPYMVSVVVEGGPRVRAAAAQGHPPQP